MYVVASSWVAGGNANSTDATLAYLSGGLSAASFFSFRMLDYRVRYEHISIVQRLSISFFDLVTYFSIIALVVWGIIFPVLRQIPQNFQLFLFNQNTLALNLDVGLILCSTIIIARVALQPLIAKSSNIMTIARPQKVLAKEVPTISDSKSVEIRTFEMLASIEREIAKLRDQISLLSKNTGNVIPPVTRTADLRIESRSNSSGISRVPEIENKGRPTHIAPVKVNVVNLISNSDKVPPDGSDVTKSDFQLPDSAKDNPWSFVLSQRQQRQKTPEDA
ncbi:MAG: hypothetical protein OK439_04435 [Thaumarchaeota archaeon]|nr:hypothetical protein [Nitrososphaerota archaeon]